MLLRGKTGGGEGGFKVLLIVFVIVVAIVNNLYLGYKTVVINQEGVSCDKGVFRAAAPVNTAGLMST
jgi:hypothetical protein